jgi:ankyrin repeat protein
MLFCDDIEFWQNRRTISKMPENKDDIDLEGWHFHRAAYENRVGIAQALIARGDDVDAIDEDGFTPLYVAAWRNSLDVARLLNDRGADVDARNKDGSAPLHEAARYNSLDVARLLIEQGTNTDGIDLNWMN